MSRESAMARQAENAVVKYMITRGAVHAERRALRGRNDALDIVTGVPGLLIDVKCCPSGQRVTAWVRNAEKRRGQHGATVAVVWSKDIRWWQPEIWTVWLGEDSAQALLSERQRDECRHRFRGGYITYRINGRGLMDTLVDLEWVPRNEGANA